MTLTPYELLASAKEIGYIGEPVSQLQHGLQAAHFAKKAGKDDEVVLACLFHDIGHLCVDNVETMGEYGIAHHEKIGASFLLEHGYSQRVALLVESHVAAKRYLISTKKQYHQNLSDASKQTLIYQGGPMTNDEIKSFQHSAYFKDSLFVRACDEKAKLVDFQVEDLAFYKNMIEAHKKTTIHTKA